MADVIWLAGNKRNIMVGMPEDLILNGSFDEIFRFKGYDLKTGKVIQEAHRGVAVKISASGHEFRWTKNALERNGFTVCDDAAIMIHITQEKEKLIWHLTRTGEVTSFTVLESLINVLQ
jgi:iron complex transport system ATP-binding protein